MPQKHLTTEECYKLLKEFNTPPHVIRHCEAVAAAAVRLAEALNSKGSRLDIDLIRGAALLHDIARVEDRHWEKGAEIARSHGYGQEADIIQVHMDYEMHKEVDELTEADLVCFGDRVVKEDEYVGLAERMDYVLNKVRGIPEAVERIKRKQEETELLFEKIESRLGMPIGQLMGKK